MSPSLALSIIITLAWLAAFAVWFMWRTGESAAEYEPIEDAPAPNRFAGPTLWPSGEWREAPGTRIVHQEAYAQETEEQRARREPGMQQFKPEPPYLSPDEWFEEQARKGEGS